MSDENPEFREEIRMVIRRHDPSADELRSLEEAIGELADRYEAADEII